jgi:Na+/H+ antiporter NhaD/arsenite permease-like protein
VGDPPLFLGYLKGIPFWWVTEHCWPIWAVGVAYLLVVFFVIDRRNYLRAPKAIREALAEPPDRWRFDGAHNLLFLAVILGAVFISDPPFVREGLMIVAAFASYFSTADSVHQSNHFDFHPIKEVAVLFAGIFATMIPALDWLQMNAGKFGLPTETLFFWSSGMLSSVLDNAPTYLSFLSAIFGSFINQETVVQVQHLVANGGTDLAQAIEPVRHTYEALQKYDAVHLANKTVNSDHIQVAYLLGNTALNGLIVAISVAAVFFGANTYIGNGPNFMVKSIADRQKVHTPGFIGFVLKFTIPIMMPMLVLVWLLFFRH